MKIIGLSIVFVVVLSSCTKTVKEQYYTKEEVQRITDSALQANLQAAKEAAEKDLEFRKAIELKARMDSIKEVQKAK